MSDLGSVLWVAFSALTLSVGRRELTSNLKKHVPIIPKEQLKLVYRWQSYCKKLTRFFYS